MAEAEAIGDVCAEITLEFLGDRSEPLQRARRYLERAEAAGGLEQGAQCLLDALDPHSAAVITWEIRRAHRSPQRGEEGFVS